MRQQSARRRCDAPLSRAAEQHPPRTEMPPQQQPRQHARGVPQPVAQEAHVIQLAIGDRRLRRDMGDRAVVARVPHHQHRRVQRLRRVPVQLQLDVEAGVAPRGPQAGPDVGQLAESPLERRADRRDRRRIETKAHHQQEPAPAVRRPLAGAELHATQVHQDRRGVDLGADRGRRAATRDPGLARPHVGRSPRHDPDGRPRLRRNTIEPVQDLVESAVAAAGEDQIHAVGARLPGQIPRLTGPLRPDQTRVQPRLRRHGAHGPIEPLARGQSPRPRIGDEQDTASGHRTHDRRSPLGDIPGGDIVDPRSGRRASCARRGARSHHAEPAR